MSILAKRILALALIGGLCMHFGLIVIYSSPLSFKSPKIQFISSYYTYPFFHQSWSLFVPAPRTEHQLCIRYQTKAGWSNWKDVLGQEIIDHRKNRINGNENVVLLFSNALHFTVHTLPPVSAVFTNKLTTTEFQVLRHELNQYLVLKESQSKNTAYEILIIAKRQNQTTAYYFKSLTIY